jgi:hypothetical protein
VTRPLPGAEGNKFPAPDLLLTPMLRTINTIGFTQTLLPTQ